MSKGIPSSEQSQITLYNRLVLQLYYLDVTFISSLSYLVDGASCTYSYVTYFYNLKSLT
jgi:hypothetical protein